MHTDIQDIQEKILEEHQELSSLPQTMAEVLRIVQDEKSSARDLANVLMKDPALAAKMLRLANSPYFGAGRQITSITQAVMILGLRATTALALSASIYDLTGKWQSSIERVRFWRHSLSVAITAREIATLCRYECAEEAFVCGLLHDIGLLVLEKSFPDRFARIWQQAQSGENIIVVEEHHWGTNHARIGQFLLEQWQLPTSFCEAVGHHHRNFAADDNGHDNTLSSIVALANLVTSFSLTTVRTVDAEILKKKEALTAHLGIENETLQQIEETISARTLREAEFLEIDIGSRDDLLTDANRVLYRQYLTVEKLFKENRSMQQEIAKARLEKAALRTIKTISATFNHYINNAIGTILGRAELVQSTVKDGRMADTDAEIDAAMDVIIKGVNTIRSVTNELTNLSTLDTTVYYDDTFIIDIENKIKERIENIDDVSSAG